MPITVVFVEVTPEEEAAAMDALIRALDRVVERLQEKDSVVKEQSTISDSNIISDGQNG